MIGEEFLAILRCPLTHEKLVCADTELLAEVNGEIERGKIVNRSGELVHVQLDGGLFAERGAHLFPIHDGIPSLLADEAIPLDQLSDESSCSSLS